MFRMNGYVQDERYTAGAGMRRSGAFQFCTVFDAGMRRSGAFQFCTVFDAGMRRSGVCQFCTAFRNLPGPPRRCGLLFQDMP